LPEPTFVAQFFGFILAPFIRKIRISDPILEGLKETLARGQVVFVAQTASIIDFLVISSFLKRNGLPALGFTHGIPGFFHEPFLTSLKQCAKRLFRPIARRAEWEREDIKNARRKGLNGLIFLKNRSGIFKRKTFYYHGFFLDFLTEETPQPTIFLVPTSIFLTRKRKSLTRTGWEILFGTYDIPSRTRKLWQLLTHVNRGLAIFSKPVALSDAPELTDTHDPEKTEKRLSWTLLIHLNNEDRAYRGPTKRRTRQKVRLILKDRVLKKELEQIAERQNRPIEAVYKEAEKTLSNITSDTNERVLFILKTLFDFVWYRTLDGVDINPRELAMIRELATKGPIVLLPSHRSHVDYLVLAHTFEANGLNPPRFAAGDNLARWPLGPILRRSGAFFIRRSFKGEAIFPVVFEAYIRQTLRDRQPLTFFMEGGRSRTGKLLNPKMGLLGMILNSWSNGLAEHIPLIPITIDYGKVFEGQAYLVEKSGAEKKKEGLKSLLSTPKFLKRKHGVVRIRISKPFYFEDELEALGLDRNNLTFRNKIPFLNSFSKRIMNQINSRVSLTAGNLIAGILLSNPRRGLTYTDLKSIFTLCVRFLRNKHVEMAFKEKNIQSELEHAIDTFIAWETVFKVKMGANTIIKIPVEKRSEMEYYKNNGIHFFLDIALFAAALEILPNAERNLVRVKELAGQLYEIFSSEFIVEENFFENIDFAAMAHIFILNGGLVQSEDGLFHRGPSDVGYKTFRVTSHILLNFIESYFCVLDVLLQDDFEKETPEKEFGKMVLSRSKLLYSIGSILLPESRNQINFSNATNMLKSRKIIQFRNIPNQQTRVLSLKDNKVEIARALHQQLYEWMDELQ